MEEKSAPTRLEALDLYRGVMILAVVGIHVTGAALKTRGVGPLTSDVLLVLNRALQFGVPGFLFMTALVFAHQYRERPLDVQEFFTKRLKGVIVPFVVWTEIYVVYRQLTVVDPRPLADVERWIRLLVTGKAFYHLYFLVVVLQFYVLFPVVARALRRTQWDRGWTLAAFLLSSIAIQVGFFWLNRTTFRIDNVGSIVFSYTFVMACGLIVGRFLPELKTLLLSKVTTWLTAMFVAFLLIGPVCVGLWFKATRGMTVNSFAAQSSLWIYAVTASLLVLSFCLVAETIRRPDSRFYRAFLVLGASSMQIYLMHPLLLDIIKRGASTRLVGVTGVAWHLPIYIACVVLPVVVALTLRGRRTSVYLFGR